MISYRGNFCGPTGRPTWTVPAGPGERAAECRAAGLALAAFLAVAAVGSTARAMPLEQAVALTVSTNPEIGEAINNRLAVDQELAQARGRYLPQIDARGEVGPEFVETEEPQFVDDERSALPRWQLSLVLQQRIFDGFATDAEVERQAARADAAAYRVLERSEFIALDTVQAYLDLMRTMALLRLSRANIEVHRAILADARRRAQAGELSVADPQQAEERLLNARRQANDFETDLEQARITFERLVGQPPGQLTMPPPVVGALPADRESAVTLALDNNPRIRLALADLDVSHAEFRAAESAFYPELSLESTASIGEDIAGDEGEDVRLNVLLVARYRLFSGFIDSANRQEQVARVAEARERVDRFRREVVELARQSWTSLEGAQRNIDVLDRQVELARQVVSSYRQQFSLGERSLLDVLDAENELFNARVALASTRFAAEFARYRILASTGMLLDSFDIAPPGASDAAARDGAGNLSPPPQRPALSLDDDFFQRRR
jgi:adhesin transport system outer membrane protein